MGYRIVYDKQSGSGIRRLFFTILTFGCFLWAVSFFWPEGRELLRAMIIPGDPDRTIQAAEVFAQELGSGFSLSDAARNFWIAVMQHGNPS